MNQENQNGVNLVIRSLVRGAYDIQTLRVATGNRVTANFKYKLGFKNEDNMTEEDLEKISKGILNRLTQSYTRITDGVIEEGAELIAANAPSLRKFVGDEVISTYAEFTLVHGYMKLLSDEKEQFKMLESAMKGIPIYDKFLSEVDGIGPQMAGVIISEIDIYASQYSSSIWKYAGLDVVRVARYFNAQKKECEVPNWMLVEFYNHNDSEVPYLAEGKYPVVWVESGRSRRAGSLVRRDYLDNERNAATRNSITFNPFLKTKLIGVLGSSFLRSGKVMVDGKRMGSAKRLALAKENGYKSADEDSVDGFLRGLGHEVREERSQYGKAYYDYRARLDHMREHSDKTELHKHNMAVRYMVKLFLVDLYKVWRELEGLPVMPSYAERLGLQHGIATESKQRYYGT